MVFVVPRGGSMLVLGGLTEEHTWSLDIGSRLSFSPRAVRTKSQPPSQLSPQRLRTGVG
jgi:hypothetical protein